MGRSLSFFGASFRLGGHIVKHTGVSAASFAAVLWPLVSIVVSLTAVLPARGEEVPFFAERVISTATNEVLSVFATDVDGDGDTDVLSASVYDDKIAWYENDGGCSARIQIEGTGGSDWYACNGTPDATARGCVASRPHRAEINNEEELA